MHDGINFAPMTQEHSDISTHAAGHWADETRAVVAAIRDGTFIWTPETQLETSLRLSIKQEARNG